MLTTLYRQLCTRLTDAGFTACAEDTVPGGAAFPFVTCRIEPPLSMHETGRVTLTCWHRSGTAHADRLAAADALIRLIPSGGLQLPLENGLAFIFRSGENAVAYPESPGALGVCVRHDLRVFGGC